MTKSAEKLVNKKIIVVGGVNPLFRTTSLTNFSRIGFGAAQAFLDAGAIVTVISSNQENVETAVKRLNSPNASGVLGNVPEEKAFVETLKKLAPVDHIVFSGVDKIIRGKLEDLDLDEAKHLFGVKFWGAVIIGKGPYPISPSPPTSKSSTHSLQPSRNTLSSPPADL